MEQGDDIVTAFCFLCYLRRQMGNSARRLKYGAPLYYERKRAKETGKKNGQENDSMDARRYRQG